MSRVSSPTAPDFFSFWPSRSGYVSSSALAPIYIDFEASMESVPPHLVRELRELIDQAAAKDDKIASAFEVLHQGYPDQTLERFLKARETNVPKALKMVLDCLHWRVKNEIDTILSKPILPKDTYDAIRDSQLIGMTGYCKKGRPVFAIGVGLSGYDKAPVDKYVQSHIQINEYRDRILLPQTSLKNGQYIGTCLKILDMSNLKLSALNRLKILTVISTVDDLNYPEKTDIYFIVNPPYIFSACWKVVKPLLQERTKRKIRVLEGCGRDELLKIMDFDVLPPFCKSEPKQSGSSRGSGSGSGSGSFEINHIYSSSHSFHVELWNYMKQQSLASPQSVGPTQQKSFHVEVPEPDEEAHSIEVVLESTLAKLADENGNSSNGANNVVDRVAGLHVAEAD